MKRLALIALTLSIALTHFASAEDNEKKAQKQAARQNAAVAKMAQRNPGQVRSNARTYGNPAAVNSAARSQFRAQGNRATFNPGVGAEARGRPNNIAPRIATPTAPQAVGVNPEGRRNWSNGDGNRGNQNWRNRDGDGNGNQDWRNDGERNNWRNGDGDGNRNWRNRTGQSREWKDRGRRGHANWDRTRRDRSYWTSRYSRFARFGGGYYYWNSGFWYPAYGYDPYFSTYTYDAPIYGYNNLDPGQVIANVQAELQRAGYYRGGLDGQFGPMTRQALLNYQSDNGLPASGEIDEDTLDALGLQ